MTPGSNHSLVISRTVIEKNRCARSRQQKPRSVKTCYFSESKDQRRAKSPSLWNCLTFCFKDHPRMEQREPAVNSQADGTEGRLGDVASKWPRDTQVPLVVHDGLFPTWFLGFTSREGAEEILRGKETDCFLIRLSDKAIGYILSYKDRDRCRHFVINQSESGHRSVEIPQSMTESLIFYHLAGMPGNSLTTLSETRSEQHLDSVYAEVHTECLVGRSPHANQLIVGHEDTVKLKTNSTYEPLEDIRPKHNHSTWGVKNNKWRWL